VLANRFKRYRVAPGQKVHLGQWNPSNTAGFKGKKEDGLVELQKLSRTLEPLQEMLYAEHKHKLLVVLQGLDTAGKDGTIRRVFEGVNPQGVRVAHFREPTPDEVDHDFLWRIHKEVPGKGEIVIFNRSHYESVLVERVHKIVPKDVWERRYGEIKDFERMLSEEGTTILKFYLHISKAEQKKRIQDRLKDPTKQWKFGPTDLPERKLWSGYLRAYEDAIERTSEDWAPWYVVPSNHAWFRDLLVSSVIVRSLEKMKLRYPSLAKDPKSIVVK
jgi:PPK2 family polyphosphate:nucleotide phosphotransferase